jgi:hypothetical protein
MRCHSRHASWQIEIIAAAEPVGILEGSTLRRRKISKPVRIQSYSDFILVRKTWNAALLRRWP